MARIFSIEFPYNDAVYHAMITVRQTAFHTEYKISLQDQQLTRFLLSDKIVSPSPGDFIFANFSVAEYTDLMKQILSAVANHVHSFQH